MKRICGKDRQKTPSKKKVQQTNIARFFSAGNAARRGAASRFFGCEVNGSQQQPGAAKASGEDLVEALRAARERAKALEEEVLFKGRRRCIRSNSRRLVLGCMNSYDSEKRRIFLQFSRSTRFASFCTVLISDSLQICIKFLLIFSEISQNFGKILQKSEKSRNFSRKNCKKSANFDIAALQKNANLVDCEKCRKMRLFSLS